MSFSASVSGTSASDHSPRRQERHDRVGSDPGQATAASADIGPVPGDRPASAADERAQRVAEAKAKRAERRRIRASAPVPQRAPLFGHLSLPDLREIRRVVQHEEERTAYWHRVIESRLVVVRDRLQPKPPVADLRGVLRAARESPSRTAAIVPSIEAPVLLPDLAEMWSRDVDYADEAASAALEAALAYADQQLTAYRLQLQSSSKAITAELIARYREAPQLALNLLA